MQIQDCDESKLSPGHDGSQEALGKPPMMTKVACSLYTTLYVQAVIKHLCNESLTQALQDNKYVTMLHWHISILGPELQMQGSFCQMPIVVQAPASRASEALTSERRRVLLDMNSNV